MRILTIIFLFLVSKMAFAVDDFKCTIKDSIYLEDDGMLNHKSYVVTGYVGKEFIVNRSTGLITGAGISNIMSGQMPLVYDYLPNENGYKAVTHYKPNNTIDYLQINQYTDAKEKPFFFKGAFGTMVSGTYIAY